MTAYTTGASYAGFDEKQKGKVQVGYLADLVLLDRDITSCSPDEIKNTSIVWTMLDGKLVYQAEEV